MIDEYMMKLIQIKNGYTIKRVGVLTDIENATNEYDSLCLELIKQLDLYKSVIDEIYRILKVEKDKMGYAIHDSCLLLIQEQLDKANIKESE